MGIGSFADHAATKLFEWLRGFFARAVPYGQGQTGTPMGDPPLSGVKKIILAQIDNRKARSIKAKPHRFT